MIPESSRRLSKDRRQFYDLAYSGRERRISYRRIRDQIDIFFKRLGHRLYRNPVKALLFVLITTLVLILQIPNLVIDTSTEALLRKDDPIRLEYNEFRDQFGKAEMVIIAIQPPNIFDEAFLKKLKKFHTELENGIPYIKNVTSLINIRSIRSEGDALIVQDLLENWPDEEIDMPVFQQKVMGNPVYLNTIISEDARLTAVIIETEASVSNPTEVEDALNAFTEDDFSSDEDPNPAGLTGDHYLTPRENHDIVEAVQRIVDRYQDPDFKIFFSGSPVVTDIFNISLVKDMKKCMLLSVMASALFFGLLFRRVSGVILPQVIVSLSMISTVGLMALCNVPFKITTMIIPGFLVGVGLADSVHVLSIFYRHYSQNGNKENAVAFSLGHSGLPIVMTSMTTAAGLLSFSYAKLTAIAEMGIFAASGVLLAVFYTIIMLPALLALLPIKQTGSAEKKSHVMDRVLLFFADFSTSRPVPILFTSAVIFVFSLIFVTRLEFSHNDIEYFPDNTQVKKDLIHIDRELKGVLALEVIIDTGKENGIYEPEILNRIDSLAGRIETIKRDELFVGKVISIVDILKETNQALNGNHPDHYTVPQNRDAIAQQFLLIENSGSEDLEKIVDSQFQKTRFTIKTPWVDSVIFEKFIKEIHQLFNETFKDKADIGISGEIALMARTIPATLHSMTQSYLIAFAVITVMMIILVGDLRIGLLSMIPNLLPILFVMGLIGLSGLPLSLNTLMIGSIAIGLVVDDTIHFMYNFRRYYMKTNDAYIAVRETLLSTGRALLITTLILSAGFFCIMFGSLKNFVHFGFFTGLTIIFALLADFLVAPALMVFMIQKKIINVGKHPIDHTPTLNEP